jgi:hypothetical protein
MTLRPFSRDVFISSYSSPGPQNTAQIARKDYFGMLSAKRSKVEQRIRDLLAENPHYTFSQLAKRANCCYADAKKWVERIQSN